MTADPALLILSAAPTGTFMTVGGNQLRGLIGFPSERRGVMLACAAVALAMFGLVLVINGDLVGLAYLGGAVASYLFLHARALPALIWTGVSAAGLVGLAAGSPAGLIQTVIAAGLVVIALWRPAVLPATETQPIQAGDSAAGLASTPLRALGEQTPGEAVTAHKLSIQSIGGQRVMASGKDLTAALTRKPTIGFLWTYLFARALAGERAISRAALAEEAAPNLPAKARAERFRRQLWDLQNDLPAPLGSMVRADRTEAWLDLGEAQVDVIALRDLAHRTTTDGSFLDGSLRAEAEAFLAGLPPGEFLPRFEELETAVNDGRGTAGSLVGAIRRDVVRWRGDIAHRLADHYLAAREPARAAALLVPVLEEDPSREDIARQLLTAYVRTGQTARADELRRNFNLNQEG